MLSKVVLHSYQSLSGCMGYLPSVGSYGGCGLRGSSELLHHSIWNNLLTCRQQFQGCTSIVGACFSGQGLLLLELCGIRWNKKNAPGLRAYPSRMCRKLSWLRSLLDLAMLDLAMLVMQMTWMSLFILRSWWRICQLFNHELWCWWST